MCSPYPVGLLRSGGVGCREAMAAGTLPRHSPRSFPWHSPRPFSRKCPLRLSCHKLAVLLDLSGRSAEI
jgi:hypothetical protein